MDVMMHTCGHAKLRGEVKCMACLEAADDDVLAAVSHKQPAVARDFWGYFDRLLVIPGLRDEPQAGILCQ